MFWKTLIGPLGGATDARRVRLGGVLVLGVLLAVWLVRRPSEPAETVELVTWSIFLVAIVVGGATTGWRVAQWPKSRAAEFLLVAPRSDWELVGSQVLSGMLRTALVVGASTPLVALLWGWGWIGAAQAAAILSISLMAAWVAGLLLAVVAYEPAWVRLWCERLVLALVVVYLVAFGLLGQRILPPLVEWWSAHGGAPAGALVDVAAVWRYFNPFRLLGTLGDAAPGALAVRTAAVLGLLGLVLAAAVWRLVRRLRAHYWDENYSTPQAEQESAGEVGRYPLAWWTVRRVSRFRGSVNLYLFWATTVLYCGWLVRGDAWPAWLGANQLRLIDSWGGAALLGAAALQLAVLPAAFLNGLWDSNSTQRAGRLELLLVTPLDARQYLWGSAAAAWTRGRAYLLAGLVVWMAAAATGHLTWPACLALSLVGGTQLLLYFALAFRQFARIRGDAHAAAWGLALAVGLPLVSAGLLHLGWNDAALTTPLGASYLLAADRADAAAAAARVPLATSEIVLLAAAVAVQVAASLWLLRGALVAFDREIREWLVRQWETPAAAESA